jgi:hypothetical protein
VPQRTPGLFRKLDAVAVLTARLLPARLEARLAMTPREVGLQAQPFLERVTFPDSGGDDRGGHAR